MLTKDSYYIKLKTKKDTDTRQGLFIIYSYKEQITLTLVVCSICKKINHYIKREKTIRGSWIVFS